MTHSPLPASERETITGLERDWPAWQIWTVHPVIGPTVWCARRWDGAGRVLNAHSPADLARYLTEATS